MPKMASKQAARSSKKNKVGKRSVKVLATCPVNGAGWCPYPFSVEQLERRLREKELAQSKNQ